MEKWKDKKIHRNLLIFGFIWGLISGYAIAILSLGHGFGIISCIIFFPGYIAILFVSSILPKIINPSLAYSLRENLPIPTGYVFLFISIIIALIITEIFYRILRQFR